MIPPPGGAAPTAPPSPRCWPASRRSTCCRQDSDSVDARPTTPSSSPPAPSPARTPPSATPPWSSWSRALDAAGSGAVVAGDAASAGENGLVGVIRADPDALGGGLHRRQRRTPRPAGSAPSWPSARESEGTSGQVRHRGGHPAGAAGARRGTVTPRARPWTHRPAAAARPGRRRRGPRRAGRGGGAHRPPGRSARGAG